MKFKVAFIVWLLLSSFSLRAEPLVITDVSQLDFSGDFTHALNFNGSGIQTIGDATFANVNAAGTGAPAGVTITNFNVNTTWGGASNLGTSADSNTLENVMRTIIWSARLNPGQISLPVIKDDRYRLQLLFSEGCCNNRHYTVDVEDKLSDVVAGTSVGGTVWMASSTQGYAWITEFDATDNLLEIDFSRLPPGDTNYHISGLTLERIPNPSLTLIKNPTNDSGGTALPNDFQLTVDGNSVDSGVSNTYPANTPLVINETQLSGYKFVSITGKGCPANLGDTITLNDGDDITCTITNNDGELGYTMSKASATPSTNLGSNTTITDTGDTIEYTFTFVNTGAFDLINLAVQDPLFGAGNICTIASLPVGATDNTSCVLNHTLTQANVDAGSLLNTATSSAYAPDGTTTVAEDNTANDNSVTTTITQYPRLSIVKSDADLTGGDLDNTGDVTLGDILTYTVTATNEGNINLTNVIVSDPKLTGSSFTCPTLAPGSTCVLTGTHEVSTDEATIGEVVNVAGVTSNEITTSVSSNQVTTPVAVAVNLTVSKTVNNPSPNAGDTITFSLLVENLGPGTAIDVLVTDIIPLGFTYVAGSMTGISPTVANITADESTPTTGSGLRWTVSTLSAAPAADSSTVLTFQAVVNTP